MSIVNTPAEIMIYNIVSQLDVRSLLNLCETNTSFREYCDTDLVWKILTERDFPGIYPQTSQSWKELYFSKYNKIIEKVNYWLNNRLLIDIKDKSIAERLLNIINIPELNQLYNYFEGKQQRYFHKIVNIRKVIDETYEIHLNYSPITVPSGVDYEKFFQQQTWKVSVNRMYNILFRIAIQDIPVQTSYWNI